MQILDLTSSEAVRAAIGVSSDSGELPDQLFTDLGIESLLTLELYGWLPKTVSDIKDAADAETDETAPASLAYLALKACATYFCAALILESGEISFAVKQSDGQNEFQRQPKDIQQMLARMVSRYSDYRQQVLAYMREPATEAVAWFIGSSSPTYDPVTNR